MRKMIALLLAAALSVTVLASCSSSGGSGSDSGSSDSSSVQTDDTESSADDSGENELYSFQIKIDGVNYTLPATYSDFQQNGWELRGEDESVGANTKMIGVYLKKDKETINIQPYNPGESEAKISECQIVYLSVDIKDVESIEMPGGFKFDVNTKPEDVKAKYGEPDGEYNSEESDRYTYKYEKSTYSTVQFTMYGDNATLDKGYGSITMENLLR